MSYNKANITCDCCGALCATVSGIFRKRKIIRKHADIPIHYVTNVGSAGEQSKPINMKTTKHLCDSCYIDVLNMSGISNKLKTK